jgi:hypothetical protein
MKTKIFLIVGLAVMAVAVAFVMDKGPANAPASVASTPTAPTPKAPAPEIAANNPPPAPVIDNTKPAVPVKPALSASTKLNHQPLVINGYVVQDPLARAALSYVGADAEANAYWIGAINDPTLPSEERKDLIEDLNEDGLSDPHNPGSQDMPLIAARIQLIESLAPYALDQVDANAFAEAEKDLVGMMNGQPPQ